MKHAFLIIAYNNWWQLKQLIKLLDYPTHDIYIHIDAKSKSFNKEDFDNITNYSKVYFYQEYSVYWGGFSMVEVELLLFREAYTKHYGYYHLLSGLDLPLKTNKEIDLFFEKNRGYEFIDYDDDKLCSDSEIKRRTKLYHFLQNYRRRYKLDCFNDIFVFFERCLLAAQIILRVDRTKNCNLEIKYGSQWVSITDELVSEVLRNQDIIIKIFRLTNCADELFIQTIAYNHGFKDKVFSTPYDGILNNMRLIDWDRGRNGSPYIFRSGDYNMLENSKALFARKFSETVDKSIILKIMDFIEDENKRKTRGVSWN